MPTIDEFAHDFEVVIGGTAMQFSIDETFRGNPNVPTTARIVYAIIRNNTGGNVSVLGPQGISVVGVAERKRVDMQSGARFFTVIPAVTTAAGQLTADIGLIGVQF